MKTCAYFIFLIACICAVSSDTYHYLSKEQKTWFEARDHCAKHGARLVIINSEEEANVLKSLMAPYTQQGWFLVGFNDIEDEGNYRTVTGWLEASNYCGAEGAHLVVINSVEESTVVANVMASGSFRIIHAGFHDLFIEGDYMTVTGQRLAETGFSTWYDGEPTDAQTTTFDEDCGMIYNNGTLGDQPCENTRAFICEHEV
ncbi:hypothetical protein C0J52_06669 [Blattella germanica]|nr:hypothetical protein C0J52_06669 [Blattella germanica]